MQIDVEDSPDIKSGYKITFSFKQDNPFFHNRQLVKQLIYAEDNGLEVKCTDIDWTEEGVSAASCAALQNKHNFCSAVSIITHTSSLLS